MKAVKDAEEETARQTEANEQGAVQAAVAIPAKAPKRIMLPSLNQGTFDAQRHRGQSKVVLPASSTLSIWTGWRAQSSPACLFAQIIL